MAWLTATQIREKFNIAENALANQITQAIASATLVAQASVDADIYAEGAGTALETTDDNYLRQSSVVQAHSFLVWYFLLKNTGVRLTREGALKKFQASSSAGTDKVHMNEILTPSELKDAIANALDDAKFWLGEYGTILIDEPGSITEMVSTLKYF